MCSVYLEVSALVVVVESIEASTHSQYLVSITIHSEARLPPQKVPNDECPELNTTNRKQRFCAPIADQLGWTTPVERKVCFI